MPQNVMITGAGKAVGLGFNMVLRYAVLYSGDKNNLISRDNILDGFDGETL